MLSDDIARGTGLRWRGRSHLQGPASLGFLDPRTDRGSSAADEPCRVAASCAVGPDGVLARGPLCARSGRWRSASAPRGSRTASRSKSPPAT